MHDEIWRPHFQSFSPAYQIFSWLPSKLLAKTNWPDLSDYNALKQFSYQPVLNAQGKEIFFVAQTAKATNFEARYEPRIYLTGEVQTRSENWHDIFNMLIWCTFPRIKAMLNKLQYDEIKQKKVGQMRSALENFLTLFDENGIVIVSSDVTLLSLIKNMAWKELFWYQRDALLRKLGCFIVGHSLHEKLLRPYIGMIGHSLLLTVEPGFFTDDLSQQINTIEHKIQSLDISSLSPKNLFPIPILGFPNWCPEAEHLSFYDNQEYFRQRRR